MFLQSTNILPDGTSQADSIGSPGVIPSISFYPSSQDPGAVHESPAACDGPETLAAPRLVTRGESYEENPNAGESVKIITTRRGKPKLVFVPVTKPDGEPLAALTDFLNTTFPFNPTQENIIQLVEYFRLFLGISFGCLQERKGGLHGYKTSFTIAESGGMLAFGGQAGTALVSLPGSACALIGDWGA